MEQAKPKLEYRNRQQVYLGPVDLEALIEAGHPARAVWSLLESIDFSSYEDAIRTREGEAGRAAVPPRLLAALWIYGYSLGIGSARALERMQAHEPGLRWLCADEVVKHHTLSDFRVQRGESLDVLFSQILTALDRDGLVDLQTVAHDGTKVRAVAGKGSFHRKPTLQASLQRARKLVRQLKAETEAGDGEQGMERRREAAQRRAAGERVERMKQSLEQLRRRAAQTAPAERSQVRVSDSEPQAKRMKLADGSFAAAYNVQLSTETRSTVIVAVEATREPEDSGLLSSAMRQIQRRMGRMPERILADGGYATRSNVGWAHRRKIELFAPWSAADKRAAGATKRAGIEADYRPSAFVKIQDETALQCPAGQSLPLQGSYKHHGLPTLLFEAPATVCGECPNRQHCCPRGEGQGRQVWQVVESRAMRKYLERMESEEGRKTYRQRSRFGEFAQMQIKAVKGLRRFHVQGITKVNREATLWALAYNVMQWIRLAWNKPAEAAMQTA
jgi:transposase